MNYAPQFGCYHDSLTDEWRNTVICCKCGRCIDEIDAEFVDVGFGEQVTYCKSCYEGLEEND